MLDEAVIRRQVGGPATMRGQLYHLLEMGDLPNVDIMILPFDDGAHCAMDGPFCLVEFPEPGDAGVVYLEQAISGAIIEDPEEFKGYSSMFADLQARALTPDESVVLIASAAQGRSEPVGSPPAPCVPFAGGSVPLPAPCVPPEEGIARGFRSSVARAQSRTARARRPGRAASLTGDEVRAGCCRVRPVRGWRRR